LPVIGLDHVQLAMPAGGEPAARAFYTGILGIPETPKPSHLAARGGCWFESPSLKLHLGVDPDFRPAQKAHPGLVVDNLDQLCANLTVAGHPTTRTSPTQAYTSDPFGNRLELLT